MTSKGTRPEVLRFSHLNKNTLTAEESDLHELSNLAGIVFDQNVFKIIVDLLRLNVAPTAIERMLKSMTSKHLKKAHPDSSDTMSSYSTNTSTTNRSKISGISSRGRHPSRLQKYE